MSRGGYDPRAYLTATDGPKLELTPVWGRLLGAYVGDGSVGQATGLVISCDGQDADWIEMLMADIRSMGMNPTTEKVVTYGGEVLRRRNVRVASAHLLRVMESFGLTTPRPNRRPKRVVCVPEVIWRSPRDVVAEFIAGYFEADGSVASSAVTAVSKNEPFIRDMQRLLLAFGIESHIRPIRATAQNGFVGVYWQIRLRRQASEVFEKKINFRSQRKRARLADITSRRQSHRTLPMAWMQVVTSVEPCEVDPVDIQVEGEAFSAAGFVSHNSRLKFLEYCGWGIPSVVSDEMPYRHAVRHGETGFLVRRDHEWLKYLTALVSDRELREGMGAAGREWARGETIEGNIGLWEKALST